MATDTETTTAAGSADPPPDGRYRAQQLIAAAARFALRSGDFKTLGEGLLQEAVESIDGAHAGAVWLRTDERRLERAASHEFDEAPFTAEAGLSDAHGTVLKRFLGVRGASVWSADTEVDGLRLPWHLLLAPIVLNGEPRGVFEVMVEADRPITSYQSPLQLAGVMAGIVSDWLAREEGRVASGPTLLGAEGNDYATLVHASLNFASACGTIANESRRFVRCDRASLALGGAAPRVRSVSGQVTIDHRANQVVALNKLMKCVARIGDPLLYDGAANPELRSGLAPQIEQALDRYLDESFAKQLLIYPLRDSGQGSARSDAPNDEPQDAATANKGPIVGTLVFECFEADQPLEELKSRAEAVLGHTQLALSNALAMKRVPLMSLWRAVGSWREPTAVWRTMQAACLAAIAVGVLTYWPVDFTIPAEGTLEPQLKREVFADVEGVVDQVLVRHGDRVRADQPLVELRSPDLEVAIADIAGQRRVAEEQALADARKMVDARLETVERHRLAGSRKALLEQQRGLEKQQALLEQKRGRLQVRSGFAGEVITWDAARRLLNKPVRQGERLLTVADPSGPWELELFIQDRRLGHVLRAARESDEPLTVEFILATHPTERFTGTLRKVHEISQQHADQGWGALAQVTIDSAAVPELRSGARVSARVVCGRRSIGFAWFHELAEWFASHVFF